MLKQIKQGENKMAYVIYRTDTTEIVSESRYCYSGQVHKTLGLAKASLTRIRKQFAKGFANQKAYSYFRFKGLGLAENGKSGRKTDGELTGEMVEMKIVDLKTYKDSIEQQVERTHFMTGEKFKESVNAPSFCSASSETFWSM